jgi:hypothetical protein
MERRQKMTQRKYCHPLTGRLCAYLMFERKNGRVGKAVCFKTEFHDYIGEMKECPLLEGRSENDNK